MRPKVTFNGKNAKSISQTIIERIG